MDLVSTLLAIWMLLVYSVSGTGLRTSSARLLKPQVGALANADQTQVDVPARTAPPLPPTFTDGIVADGPQPDGPFVSRAATKYRAYPEFDNIMPISVTTPASGTAPGYVFLANMGIFGIYNPAIFILENNGEPLFLRQLPLTSPPKVLADFKKRTVNGQDRLTYFFGDAPNPAWANGRAYALDQTYSQIEEWNIGNGYEASGADLHDFQLMPNGSAVLLSYVSVPYDLSPFGGPVSGTVVDMVIQEQDAAHNVVFEWRGLQHIPLTDSYAVLSSTTPLDYIHTNAIEPDSDGNLLVSNRNTSQIIKIDRSTGNVLWRLGGKSNEFDLNGDTGFAFQHDIRRLPNGNITVFDNGNLHNPRASRQLEYEIDEVNKVVTRTWQFPDDNSRYTYIMGNAQRLPNGNTIGSWAVLNKVTEVMPNGTLALELGLGEWTYRAFRDTWEATPSESPRLVALRGSDPTTATLYFGWNGATDVLSYSIYAGPTLTSTTLVTTTMRTGFETSLALSDLPADTCVYQVRPRRATGPSLPLSNAVYRMEAPACLAQLKFTYMPVVMR